MKVEGSCKYNTAENSKFYTGGSWGSMNNQPYIVSIKRKTSLEGRMNIYVAPSGNGTLLTVNCRYILKCDFTNAVKHMDAIGMVIHTDTIRDSWSNVFTTRKPNTVDLGNGQQSVFVTCCSNGKLEQEILSFIK